MGAFERSIAIFFFSSVFCVLRSAFCGPCSVFRVPRCKGLISVESSEKFFVSIVSYYRVIAYKDDRISYCFLIGS